MPTAVGPAMDKRGLARSSGSPRDSALGMGSGLAMHTGRCRMLVLVTALLQVASQLLARFSRAGRSTVGVPSWRG